MAMLDVVGPVMIGPSSSHTLGAVRIGRFVNELIDGIPDIVTFYLCGSFATTYKGHGTDRALVGGILGMKDDDENIRNSIMIAESLGLDFKFDIFENDEIHPNTVRIECQKNGIIHDIWGSSIGGGAIEIFKINGVECSLDGKTPVIFIVNRDIPGALSRILSKLDINVANLYLKRLNKLKLTAAAIIELDKSPENRILKELGDLDVVLEMYYIPQIF
ncbi:MAG: L-serine ammonia-lyase, iron-sulfur-dependent subunit beta [Thermotogae bacterium]|nr:L-serine ammonia-lyase, iron-sulfur-dependent subunit beta [Thermotogota bacterium]